VTGSPSTSVPGWHSSRLPTDYVGMADVSLRARGARPCPRHESARFHASLWVTGPITDEGVAFDSDTATGFDADCAPRRGCAIIPVFVIHRQEVRPMYAVSIMGAPLQGTIARLR
jgi:hypothetical protein